jgi:ankyrin repeat protein
MRVGRSFPALTEIPVTHEYQEKLENKDTRASSRVLSPDLFLEKNADKRVVDNDNIMSSSSAFRPQEKSSSAHKKIKKVKPPLYRAAEKGNIQKLVSNLEKGADPNQPCNEQPHMWPLLTACVMNNIECVGILLENGANPNVVDRGGYSPLSYAVSNARHTPEICKLLLHYGASLDAKWDTYMTITQRFKNFSQTNSHYRRQ